MNEEKKKERLFSLDALRGLDMLFLCVVGGLATKAAGVWGFADTNAYPFMRQFQHYWLGFTAYDIIMPMFIFMSGAAIPFALGRRLDAEGRPTAAFWKHIAWRFVLLWFLGMVAQGNIRTLDPMKISPYNNTLQTIAAGYLIAALVMLIKKRWLRIAIPAALAIIYTVMLQVYGQVDAKGICDQCGMPCAVIPTCEHVKVASGNFAQYVEQVILGWCCPAGSQAFKTFGYTWFLTTFMFGFMAMCGSLSSEVIKGGLSQWGKAGALGAMGGGMLVVGLIAEWCGIPCIKHIFTLSFTLQAMGWCVLLLAALYVITDIWKLRRGLWLVTLFGQTALACYLVGSMFRGIPANLSGSVFFGLERFVGGKYMPFVYEIGTCIFLALALWIWRRARSNKKG